MNIINHIYIHVPFCLKKCGYCSFYSEAFTARKEDEYIEALLKEIELFQQRYTILPKTIYIGGGTPSLLNPDNIGKVLAKFDLSQIQEITLEVNPLNVTEEFADKLIQLPVNRISMGAQSFLDKELKLLGRLHDAGWIRLSYDILRRAGFENISLDLIYGLPDQSCADVEYSLQKLIELSPEHISTYCLSLEEDVPLYKFRTQLPADESVSQLYYTIRKTLLTAGYDHYEISNFAKSGFESKHNLCYWSDKFYLGLGPAAAGYLPGDDKIVRYVNSADLNEYLNQINSGDILTKMDCLSAKDHETEYIFLALRKAEGLNLDEFKDKFSSDFMTKYAKQLNKFQQQNLLENVDGFVRLTPPAYFISNAIFAEFV